MAGQVNTPIRVATDEEATPSITKEKARSAPPPRTGFRRLHWNALDPQSAERSLYATEQLASPFDIVVAGLRAPQVGLRRARAHRAKPPPQRRFYHNNREEGRPSEDDHARTLEGP